RAFEDHASTLRQFVLILRVLRSSDGWLDAYRPPRSLHFAGHMRVAGNDGSLAREIRSTLEHERVGFAYGALAAGADILIAEALLESGAELHIVLPSSIARFRTHSVVAFGRSWARRFDGVLEHATSVRATEPDCDPRSLMAIRLAADVAMGLAAMQAR